LRFLLSNSLAKRRCYRECTYPTFDRRNIHQSKECYKRNTQKVSNQSMFTQNQQTKKTNLFPFSQ
jgi:hypothetical protein